MSEVLQAAEERSGESLRVLIVDDHDLFRTGLRNLLEEQGVVIVGEAATGAEAVKIVREIAPDVVVMDLNMPGMGGVDATRHITAIAPLTRVVMLTISEDDGDVMDAILAGACGYLLKDSSIQDLMAGIRAASHGESLISPNIAAKVLQRVRATSTQPEIANTIRAELSDREIEVLKLIANGKDNAVIAGELHISPKTVKNHISNILMKLQIDNRIQAAVYAVRSASSDWFKKRCQAPLVPDTMRAARARSCSVPSRLRSFVSSPSACVRRVPSDFSSSPMSVRPSRATSPMRRSRRQRSASSASARAYPSVRVSSMRASVGASALRSSSICAACGVPSTGQIDYRRAQRGWGMGRAAHLLAG